MEGHADAAQVEDSARAVRRKQLKEEIEEARKRKMVYTAVTVFCIIIFGVAIIPVVVEVSEFGALVSSEAFISWIGAFVAAVLAMVCAYLSEREKRRFATASITLTNLNRLYHIPEILELRLRRNQSGHQPLAP